LQNRFHVDTGPQSLFTRVRFKIRGARNLVLTHGHFKDRESERAFPSELVQPFDPQAWDLLTADVLNSGKFMRTTWSRVFQGRRWFIVFAKGDVAVTVYSGALTRRLLGPEIVKNGPFYEKVSRVHRALMEAEVST
jgi:hypothetical protein